MGIDNLNDFGNAKSKLNSLKDFNKVNQSIKDAQSSVNQFQSKVSDVQQSLDAAKINQFYQWTYIIITIIIQEKFFNKNIESFNKVITFTENLNYLSSYHTPLPVWGLPDKKTPNS